MLADALTTHAFSLGILRMLIADMSDDELARPMGPGHHSGHWVLGHLCVALDFGLRNITGRTALDEAWHKAFGPGSEPGAALPLNDKAQLYEAILTGHARLAKAIQDRGDSTLLDQPHNKPWFANTPLKDLRDVMGQMLTYHVGYHIGQLSVYRRATGKPALF